MKNDVLFIYVVNETILYVSLMIDYVFTLNHLKLITIKYNVGQILFTTFMI